MKIGKIIAARMIDDIRKNGLILTAIFIGYLLTKLLFPIYCPSVGWLGLPCPGCGMTRALLFVVSGQFFRAWNINPGIFPILASVLYCLICRYLLGIPIKKGKNILIINFVFLLLVFGIRMYFYFPGKIPYVYKDDNLLAEYIPAYHKLMQNIIIEVRQLRR